MYMIFFTWFPIFFKMIFATWQRSRNTVLRVSVSRTTHPTSSKSQMYALSFFNIWLGSCWEPAWGTPPMAKVMRKEALAYAKVGLSLRKPPVPKHLPPKPEFTYFTVLCSHLHLWLYGGLSPITVFLGGVNVQLQGNKNSWAWQECFSLQTPLKVI